MPRQVPDHLLNLNAALDHAKVRVDEEILSCPNWEKEDKEQWQRTRVQVARRLMLALSRYL